jgi:hypothetical protein
MLACRCLCLAWCQLRRPPPGVHQPRRRGQRRLLRFPSFLRRHANERRPARGRWTERKSIATVVCPPSEASAVIKRESKSHAIRTFPRRKRATIAFQLWGIHRNRLAQPGHRKNQRGGRPHARSRCGNRDKPTSFGGGPWPPHCRHRSNRIKLVRHACGCMSTLASRRASLAGTPRNRQQASGSLPSAPCRWPVTSHALVRRSRPQQCERNAPARQRSSWPRPAATPSAHVASAAYRPFVNASCRPDARRLAACCCTTPALARRPSPALRP